MTCKCESKRLVEVVGKTSDLFTAFFTESGKHRDGYVPRNMGIGGGDYLKFTYCLDCGRIQGNFPLEELEEENYEEEI